MHTSRTALAVVPAELDLRTGIALVRGDLRALSELFDFGVWNWSVQACAVQLLVGANSQCRLSSELVSEVMTDKNLLFARPHVLCTARANTLSCDVTLFITPEGINSPAIEIKLLNYFNNATGVWAMLRVVFESILCDSGRVLEIQTTIQFIIFVIIVP
jgi:hypothetical protein